MITIGEKIKAIRKHHNLTQIDFSFLIGISQGRLSEIEQDKTKPSAETLIDLKAKLNIDLNWLLADKNTPEAEKKVIINTLVKDRTENELLEIIEYIKLKKDKRE